MIINMNYMLKKSSNIIAINFPKRITLPAFTLAK
jgi:hypothetical protein